MNALKIGTAAALAAFALAGCSDNNDDLAAPVTPPLASSPQLPQLAPAIGATLGPCAELASRITYPDTVITSAAPVAAGALTIAGKPVGQHCLLTGQLGRRTSAVDSQAYAIGFEMRLPATWNGRFFYQANGGVDGSVVQATGPVAAAARLKMR